MWLPTVLLAIIGPAWDGGGSGLAAAAAALQPVYDRVVGDDGTVAYHLLAEDETLAAPLQAYARYMADLDDTHLSKEEKIAAYANAYNVFVLLGVTRAWPVSSVRDIRPMFGFFTKEEWQVGKRKLSLNDLEKEHLRPLDPRVHFIINCASASCPKLDRRVLMPDSVDRIMDEAARTFLAEDDKNRFHADTGVWEVSKIFEWYREDWGEEADVVAFIRALRPDLAAPRKLTYQEYDWDPNASAAGLDP